jgi:hypothetical protein
MPISRLFAGLVFAAGSGLAAAQAITFFEYDNFGGRRFDADNAVANFDEYGYNDRARSVIVNFGQWQLCTDSYFRGRCVTLSPGQYNNLGAIGVANNISSARQTGHANPVPLPGPGPIQGAQVVFYDRYDFGGSSFGINGRFDNLDQTPWNDRAASMVVQAGTWELCDDAYFQGRCERYGPGSYPNLGGQAGRVSSLRPVGNAPPVVVVPPTTWYPDGWGSRTRVVLYEGTNMSGRRFVIENDFVPNLDGTSFNDRAASMRVERGYWLFCSDSDLRGTCRTFGPGDYPNLPSDLSNRISSGRRVANDYPYNNNPNWSGRP